MILTTPKISAGFFVIALIIVGVFLIYDPVGDSNAEVEIIISQGDGAGKIARILEDGGLVRNEILFLFYTKISGNDKNLKAGKYKFSGPVNIPEIVNVISKGLSESEDIKFTVPEGFNVFETGERLEKLNLADSGEFIKNAIEFEGYLFPDTYRLKKGASVGDIIEKMRENFENKTRGRFLNKDEIIMASILEREVKSEEDMKIVSGILWKRLGVGMPLQVDATVAYGVCKEGPSFCDVSNVNLIDSIKVDAPYNTYTRKGFPPGPISNPGLKAMKAAKNPTPSDYWFYLSATAEDGRTIFSKTLTEHGRNRAKYLER